MTPDDNTKREVQLSRWASIAADLAGYLIGAAIVVVMFVLSGSLY